MSNEISNKRCHAAIMATQAENGIWDQGYKADCWRLLQIKEDSAAFYAVTCMQTCLEAVKELDIGFWD